MDSKITEDLKQLLSETAEIWKWAELDSTQQTTIMESLITPPHCLIAPKNQTALAAVLTYAHNRRSPVLIMGNGTKLTWGNILKPHIEMVITTAKLNRIVDYAEADLTVTVESGVKLADLQEILTEKQQFLPLDPSFSSQATIGGIIATADAGSWRQRYGGVRDLILGISVVRADGAIAKAGGRVVKNVAGYDLMKLFTGSYGTLGVICQVTLRLYPLPPEEATILLTGDNRQIQQTIDSLFASQLTPTRADLLSGSVVKKLGYTGESGLLLQFQSIKPSVEAQLQHLQTLATHLQLDYQVANLWQQLTEIMKPEPASPSITAKIGIVPQTALEFLSQYHQGLGIIHLGSGLGKITIQGGNLETQIMAIRNQCQQKQGFLTILNAPKSMRETMDVWGYTGNALTVMEQLKQKFDPNNLLNPGRFLGNI